MKNFRLVKPLNRPLIKPLVLKKAGEVKVFNKLTHFFFKSGGVTHHYKNILKTFSQIYLIFYNNYSTSSNYNQSYLNTQEFSFILKTTKYFKNIPKLLGWILSLNTSQFNLEIQKVSKKYKKKLKKKYLYKVKYIKKDRQVARVLRWIYLINYSFSIHKLKKRFLLNLLDLLLNFKKSNLFLKKVTIYKNFLKI